MSIMEKLTRLSGCSGLKCNKLTLFFMLMVLLILLTTMNMLWISMKTVVAGLVAVLVVIMRIHHYIPSVSWISIPGVGIYVRRSCMLGTTFTTIPHKTVLNICILEHVSVISVSNDIAVKIRCSDGTVKLISLLSGFTASISQFRAIYDELLRPL